MVITTFDRVSGEYKEKATLQRRAAGRLYDLLELHGGESILDVGCGPGHITSWLAGLTGGRVVGTDVSEGMINEARSLYPDMEFRCISAEDLDYSGEFDVVFCNSALQWFSDVPKAMRAMFKSLESPGKAGVCCPSTYEFAPWFGRMVMAAARRPEIGRVFQHWRSPWYQLPALPDYKARFEESGFESAFIRIDHVFGISFIDGLSRAFLLASPAHNAVVGDFVAHRPSYSVLERRVEVLHNRIGVLIVH